MIKEIQNYANERNEAIAKRFLKKITDKMRDKDYPLSISIPKNETLSLLEGADYNAVMHILNTWGVVVYENEGYNAFDISKMI